MREGVEVILILAMLLALVAKATAGLHRAGPASGETAQSDGAAGAATAVDSHLRAKRRAMRAIWWGVALAAAASIATAVALNLLGRHGPGCSPRDRSKAS